MRRKHHMGDGCCSHLLRDVAAPGHHVAAAISVRPQFRRCKSLRIHHGKSRLNKSHEVGAGSSAAQPVIERKLGLCLLKYHLMCKSLQPSADTMMQGPGQMWSRNYTTDPKGFNV